MERLKELTQLGKEMGLTAKDLKAFVTEQQNAEREERVSEREKEREEREAERREKEREQKDREREEDRKERELEHQRRLELLQEQQKLAVSTAKTTTSTTKVTPKTPRLPTFDETKDDMDAYLHRFERYAEAQSWDKDQWGVNLGALLKGKALEVYSRLSSTEAMDFQKLKEALLVRFDLTVDGFQKRFRSAKPDAGETFGQFTTRLRNYLDRWQELAKASATFEGIVDLFMREQFLRVCAPELKLFLRERVPNSVKGMAILADQYREARGGNILNILYRPRATVGPDPRQPEQVKQVSVRNTPTANSAGNRSDSSFGQKQGSFYKDTRKCNYCGKIGHIARFCHTRLAAASMRAEGQPTEMDSSGGEASDHEVSYCMGVTPTTGSVLNSVTGGNPTLISTNCSSSITHTGGGLNSMPVHSGKIDGHPAVLRVLRDTGCSGVVIRKDLVDPARYLGTTQRCTLIDGSTLTVPMAAVAVDTPFYKGKVEAMCMEKPLYDIIIGNIEGAREPGDPDLDWTVAAVLTRAQKKREKMDLKPLRVPKIVGDLEDKEIFRIEQATDPSLTKFHQYAKDGTQKRNKYGAVTSYRYKKSLLYRKFVSPRVDNGKEYLQLLLPVKFRVKVMYLAHDSLMAGHLGRRKTYHRVLDEFYWPGIQSEVTRYCRSCDLCQRFIPKGRVLKVPLGKMPLMGSPFERVALDLIGPLFPPTDRGNRYILTFMDYATRYPEAIALPKIETERVAEALVDIYSRLGVAEEILTDLGSQFIADLMKEVSRLLSFQRTTTTPYHPQCNGLVEKFNGTLKQMLKKMCAERPKDWDRYINPLLFAYREVPQDSTGFSPFELLYGRSVRGPLSILRQLWSQEDLDQEVKTTYQYVFDLRNRLEETLKLAQDNLKGAAKKQKQYFDKRTRVRQMSEGDEALVLLPINANKLLMQWRGPYKVVKKINAMDYRLMMDGKERTFHINMLKQYIPRARDQVAVVVEDGEEQCAVVLESVEAEPPEVETQLPRLEDQVVDKVGETMEDVHICGDLRPEQIEEVKEILCSYQDVLTDSPGRTTVLSHDVRLTTSDPVRVRPYPIPFSMVEVVKHAIENMLDMGVIEPCDSPYSSPVVIVKKKDGSNRFCIDFRRINQITVFDPEPMADVESIFAKLAGCKYISKFDLSKGYWQVPLTEQAKEVSSFSVPFGHFRFKVMPFGMVNAPATFNRLMRVVLKGAESADNFMDDVMLGTIPWSEHLRAIVDLLTRLRDAGLTARPSKIYIGYSSLDCLGHVVGNDSLAPMLDKLEAIEQAPVPTTKKQVRSFLGLSGFYRKFIPHYSELASPLTDLTKKGQPNKVGWSEVQETAFRKLKRALCSKPILRLPALNEMFILRTDASDKGLGAVLLQVVDGVKLPIAYASKKLLPREQNYATVELECLAVVWGVHKFHRYLYGVEFILETDHQPLTFLKRNKASNSRLMRWALLLQPYRFNVRAIRGVDNVGADYLSRT
ncbi:uncharacterized protein LOC135502607 [Lineus longissimus]|uniref:uncharacterized protein LOC135502607 n=1 Tax=Lineus longissimus TaxID=88925 RepID=UPI00315DF46F